MSLPNNTVVNSWVVDGLENVYGWLQNFAGSEDFLVKVKSIFGNSFDGVKLEELRQKWVATEALFHK
ncbi:MAG: hypothetical protein WBA93_25535 [Microcoleaceae cyanobacterium]